MVNWLSEQRKEYWRHWIPHSTLEFNLVNLLREIDSDFKYNHKFQYDDTKFDPPALSYNNTFDQPGEAHYFRLHLRYNSKEEVKEALKKMEHYFENNYFEVEGLKLKPELEFSGMGSYRDDKHPKFMDFRTLRVTFFYNDDKLYRKIIGRGPKELPRWYKLVHSEAKSKKKIKELFEKS